MKPVTSDYKAYEPQVVEVMESIDSLEVAGAITDLYKAFLNSLDYIT